MTSKKPFLILDIETQQRLAAEKFAIASNLELQYFMRAYECQWARCAPSRRGAIEAKEFMMSEYIALIHNEASTGFGASFPDFPGVVTAADRLEDLRAEAEEVLALHIEGMVEDGDSIPEPSALDAVVGLDDY